jgi:antitoxin ParD1/3/4
MASEPGIVTLSVALPELLKRDVDTKVSAGDYGSVSEFVGEAIREKLERDHDAKDKLAKKLVEGLESGEPLPFTPDHFPRKKEALIERMRRTRGSA